MELHRPGPPVVVDLGVEGHVGPVPHVQPGLGPGHGEEDHVHRASIPAGPHLQVAAAAHVGHAGHRHPGQGKDGLGVAGAVGLQHGQALHLLHGEEGGVGDLPVDLEGGDQLLPTHVGADDLPHPGAEGGDVLLPNGEPCRQGVAAVVLQQVGALLQGREEVKVLAGPAGALAPAILLQADHKHRAGVLLGQAGGHNTHHPLVPGLVRQHQAVVLLPPGQHGQALVKDLQLHGLALAVEFAQGMGHGLGLVGVLGEDELHGHGRLAHAAGGVDPRGEAVPHGGGVDGPVQGTRLHHQGVQPPAAGLFQVVEPHPDDGAVLPQKLHHVGHRAHGGQVGVLLEEGVVALLASQGHHQFQGHAHPGQVFEGVGAILPVGVHHRHGGGEFLLALVVVGDHQVDAQFLGVLHLFHGGDAAVHGDDEANPFLGQAVHRLPVHPIAFGQAVGDIVAHVPSLVPQVVGEQAGGGDAVHVIVPIDCHLFSVAQGPANARHGQVHILE